MVTPNPFKNNKLSLKQDTKMVRKLLEKRSIESLLEIDSKLRQSIRSIVDVGKPISSTNLNITEINNLFGFLTL